MATKKVTTRRRARRRSYNWTAIILGVVWFGACLAVAIAVSRGLGYAAGHLVGYREGSSLTRAVVECKDGEFFVKNFDVNGIPAKRFFEALRLICEARA